MGEQLNKFTRIKHTVIILLVITASGEASWAECMGEWLDTTQEEKLVFDKVNQEFLKEIRIQEDYTLGVSSMNTSRNRRCVEGEEPFHLELSARYVLHGKAAKEVEHGKSKWLIDFQDILNKIENAKLENASDSLISDLENKKKQLRREALIRMVGGETLVVAYFNVEQFGCRGTMIDVLGSRVACRWKGGDQVAHLLVMYGAWQKNNKLKSSYVYNFDVTLPSHKIQTFVIHIKGEEKVIDSVVNLSQWLSMKKFIEN